jgi:hypothetical protein
MKKKIVGAALLLLLLLLINARTAYAATQLAIHGDKPFSVLIPHDEANCQSGWIGLIAAISNSDGGVSAGVDCQPGMNVQVSWSVGPPDEFKIDKNAQTADGIPATFTNCIHKINSNNTWIVFLTIDASGNAVLKDATRGSC